MVVQNGPLFRILLDKWCASTIQSTIFIHCCHMVNVPPMTCICNEGLFIYERFYLVHVRVTNALGIWSKLAPILSMKEELQRSPFLMKVYVLVMWEPLCYVPNNFSVSTTLKITRIISHSSKHSLSLEKGIYATSLWLNSKHVCNPNPSKWHGHLRGWHFGKGLLISSSISWSSSDIKMLMLCS